MKYDEFAFFNQQLGRMLKDGIPLEGALRRLCKNMRRGRVRAELEALGNDLAEGRPLDQALERRRLPELYVHLLKMGARSNNLPDILLMLADHYQRVSYLWTRL
jgi:type II secretory pathway component PulF